MEPYNIKIAKYLRLRWVGLVVRAQVKRGVYKALCGQAAAGQAQDEVCQ